MIQLLLSSILLSVPPPSRVYAGSEADFLLTGISTSPAPVGWRQGVERLSSLTVRRLLMALDSWVPPDQPVAQLGRQSCVSADREG